jgi:hypothetical protein
MSTQQYDDLIDSAARALIAGNKTDGAAAMKEALSMVATDVADRLACAN